MLERSDTSDAEQQFGVGFEQQAVSALSVRTGYPKSGAYNRAARHAVMGAESGWAGMWRGANYGADGPGRRSGLMSRA